MLWLAGAKRPGVMSLAIKVVRCLLCRLTGRAFAAYMSWGSLLHECILAVATCTALKGVQ